MYTLVILCIIIFFLQYWTLNSDPTAMLYHWATSTAGSTTLNFQALYSVVSYILYYDLVPKWRRDHLTKITAILISKVINAISEYYTPLLQFLKFYFPISNYIIHMLICQVSKGDTVLIFTILWTISRPKWAIRIITQLYCCKTYLQQSVHYH